MRPPADAKLGERVKLEGHEALFKDDKEKNLELEKKNYNENG